jgi:hypothetical protein
MIERLHILFERREEISFQVIFDNRSEGMNGSREREQENLEIHS